MYAEDPPAPQKQQEGVERPCEQQLRALIGQISEGGSRPDDEMWTELASFVIFFAACGCARAWTQVEDLG
jgi:hypothetical protein